MNKYKQKVRKNQKLITFYVEKRKIESQKYTHPSRVFITYFAKEAPPLYGLLF